MARRVLVDADILVYRACSAAQTPTRFDDGTWCEVADEQVAKERVDHEIARVKEMFGEPVILALSCTERNWRRELDPTYKHNRTAKKPLLYWSIRDYLIDLYQALRWVSLEADDVIGILATLGPGAMILSNDKDFRTIPNVTLVRSITDHPIELEETTQQSADWHHLFQALMGDSTDGYPGCPGVGPKTAKKLLPKDASVPELWRRVVERYEKAGLDKAAALLQARLARILRDGEYHDGKVKLWSPPTIRKTKSGRLNYPPNGV